MYSLPQRKQSINKFLMKFSHDLLLKGYRRQEDPLGRKTKKKRETLTLYLFITSNIFPVR